MPATYRYLVEDILSGVIVCEDLPLRGEAHDETLNRGGVLTGKLPLSSALATDEILREGQVAIYVERDGRVDWGGILWYAQPDSKGRMVDVQAGHWLQYWDHRFIRKDRQFSQTEQFEIFATLIADAQDEAFHGAGFDLGIGVTWDALSGVVRDRLDDYRVWKAQNLGQALRELAAVESGFDFAMTFTLANNRIAKAIKLHHPTKGRDTQFLLEFEPGARTNVVRCRHPRDASQMAWVGDGWGDGTDAERLRSSYVDETKRNAYPPLEAAFQFSGVSIAQTLTENTAAAFSTANHPRRLPVLTVNPELPPKWGEYELGDRLRVIVRDGFMHLDGIYRLVGYQLAARTDRPDLILEEVI